MKRMSFLLLFVFLQLTLYAQEVLKVDDPLNGTTKGVKEGGIFVEGGWQATAGFNSRITYDLGQAYGEGRLEIDAVNFLPCEQPDAEKTHILSMWQGENQDRDSCVAAGESYWIVRTGQGYFNPCEYKFLTRPICFGEIDYEARIERDTQWNPSDVQHFIVEWRLNGNITLKRNGNTVYDYTHIYPLYLRYFLLGRDRQAKPNYGEQPGVIYSNVKIYVNESSNLIIPPCSGYDAGGYEDISQDSQTIEDVGGDVYYKRLFPLDDTFAQKISPDTIFGLQDNLQVGGDGTGGAGRIIFLKFDLSEFLQYEITEAKIVMSANNSGYGGGVAFLPDNNWEEESLTFNNMPVPGNNILDIKGYIHAGDTVVWDVTPIIKRGEINSFNIISYQEDGSAFYSKEYSVYDLRPYLEITYKASYVDGGSQDIVVLDSESVDLSSEDSYADEISLKDSYIEDIPDISFFSDIEAYKDTISNDEGNDGQILKDNFEISFDVVSDITNINGSSGSCSCNLIE